MLKPAFPNHSEAVEAVDDVTTDVLGLVVELVVYPDPSPNSASRSR